MGGIEWLVNWTLTLSSRDQVVDCGFVFCDHRVGRAQGSTDTVHFHHASAKT